MSGRIIKNPLTHVRHEPRSEIMDKLLFLIAVAIIAASCGTEALKVVTTWQERQVGGKWIGRIVLTPVETQDS